MALPPQIQAVIDSKKGGGPPPSGNSYSRTSSAPASISVTCPSCGAKFKVDSKGKAA